MRTTWVLLNEAAHQHRARELWGHVEPSLSRLAPVQTVTLDPSGQWRESLREALERGCCHVIAAGGDGTVGSLFDALYRLRGARSFNDVAVGAVGLGSSNDYHKPYTNFFAGVPVRVDPAVTIHRDLGLVRYLDNGQTTRERCFAISASVGVVARANALFNRARGIIRLLKRCSPNSAILAAALQSVATARNQALVLKTPTFDRRVSVTNLSIAKTCHLAGSLTYDTEVSSCDGLFAINLCEDMSRWELLRTLVALQRGRFRGRLKTLSMSCPELSIASERPFELEIDGELLMTTHAHFQVLCHKARVCV